MVVSHWSSAKMHKAGMRWQTQRLARLLVHSRVLNYNERDRAYECRTVVAARTADRTSWHTILEVDVGAAMTESVAAHVESARTHNVHNEDLDPMAMAHDVHVAVVGDLKDSAADLDCYT